MLTDRGTGIKEIDEVLDKFSKWWMKSAKKGCEFDEDMLPDIELLASLYHEMGIALLEVLDPDRIILKERIRDFCNGTCITLLELIDEVEKLRSTKKGK